MSENFPRRPNDSGRPDSLTKGGIIVMCLLVIVVALIPRIPLITAGLPFLYREDDTHHTNRVLEMYKARTLDPQYFHKPSLHFYLRLPVVHASALWLQHRGALKFRRDIRTRDPYGLAGYNFTASHPFLVETSRALSVTWSLITVLLVMAMAFRLRLSAGMVFLSGTLTALSPEFLINSPIVGVDILMALFCTASALLGLLALPSPTRFHFVVAGVLGGLAASSKYNALPVCAVPITLWIVAGWRTRFYDLFLSGAAFILAFFIASPFILVSWDSFITQLGYEVWHYQTGHAGHSADPGVQQATFYLVWLANDGIGFTACILAAIGLFASRRWGQSSFVFLSFPILFAGLMISQRTNFTRNMVPIIPFAALVCALGGDWLRSYIRSPRTRRLFDVGLVAAILAQPMLRSAELVAAELYAPESRTDLENWVRVERPVDRDVAIAGPLLMPIQLFALPGVDAFDPEKDNFETLIQRGYSYIAVPDWLPLSSSSLSVVNVERKFLGDTDKSRIVKNPSLTIWKVRDVPEWDWSSPTTPALHWNPLGKECQSSREGHCWIQSRFFHLRIPQPQAPNERRIVEMMSPWPNQIVTLIGDNNATKAVALETPGAWLPVELPSTASGSFRVAVAEVHSMESRGLSKDNRHLGVAFREFAPSGAD
jgi:hypothetical protein